MAYIDTTIIFALGLLAFWKSYADLKNEYFKTSSNAKFKRFNLKGIILLAYIILVCILSIYKNYRSNQSQGILENKIDTLSFVNNEIRSQNKALIDTLSKYGFSLNKLDNTIIRIDSQKGFSKTIIRENLSNDKGRPLITIANIPNAVRIEKKENNNYRLIFLLDNVGEKSALNINIEPYFFNNLGNNSFTLLKPKNSAIGPDDIFNPNNKEYFKEVRYRFYLKNISLPDTSFFYIKISYTSTLNKHFLLESVYYWIPSKGMTAEKCDSDQVAFVKNELLKKYR